MYYEQFANIELEDGEEVTIEEIVKRLKADAYKSYECDSLDEEEVERFYWDNDEWIVTCIDNWDYYLYRVVTDEEIERDKRELRIEREDLIRGLL